MGGVPSRPAEPPASSRTERHTALFGGPRRNSCLQGPVIEFWTATRISRIGLNTSTLASPNRINTRDLTVVFGEESPPDSGDPGRHSHRLQRSRASRRFLQRIRVLDSLLKDDAVRGTIRYVRLVTASLPLGRDEGSSRAGRPSARLMIGLFSRFYFFSANWSPTRIVWQIWRTFSL